MIRMWIFSWDQNGISITYWDQNGIVMCSNRTTHIYLYICMFQILFIFLFMFVNYTLSLIYILNVLFYILVVLGYSGI
jgi:hypothetical protein